MKTFERLEGEGALIYYSWMDIPFGESKGLNVKFLFNSIFFTGMLANFAFLIISAIIKVIWRI